MHLEITDKIKGVAKSEFNKYRRRAYTSIEHVLASVLHKEKEERGRTVGL